MEFLNKILKRKKRKRGNRNIEFYKRDLKSIKEKCKVLFIDDEEFLFIDRLKTQDHWERIDRISDLESMTQPELVDAYIIFVDIYGVGKKMGFQNEGLGLMCAIKEKYPEKKVVMYSGESGGHVSAFEEAVNIVDRTLRKTASQYEFSSLIEEFAVDAYSWNNCIKNIQKILNDDFNTKYEFNEVEDIVSKLLEGPFEEKDIEKAFDIDINLVGSIASILSLFSSL